MQLKKFLEKDQENIKKEDLKTNHKITITKKSLKISHKIQTITELILS